MTTGTRPHLTIAETTPYECGRSRGAQLRDSLLDAYRAYANLFRAAQVTEADERDAVEQTIETIARVRPQVLEELRGVADASDVPLEAVVALNARTEILALAPAAATECTTASALIDGYRTGVQTWDWHVELRDFWHTHDVAGPGYRYTGLTEHGILSKIGVNERGVALHFNILRSVQDGVGGVPVHVLSQMILTECASAAEALQLIRDVPVSASSAFTLIDSEWAVSVELSPDLMCAIEERDGSVQRTNHFLDPQLQAIERTDADHSDSRARLDLLRERLSTHPDGVPDRAALVDLLATGEGEAEITCRPDLSLGLGERWATLATVVTEPEHSRIHVLDGTPLDAHAGPWRTLLAE